MGSQFMSSAQQSMGGSMARAFVNGVFDVLHIGHARLIEHAYTIADETPVTVAVNDDASVKRLKGPDRPVNGILARIEMLKALRWVGDVLVFSEDSPRVLLAMMYEDKIGPSIVVKGSEYKSKSLPERGIVEANGGTIIFFENIPDVSTTKTLHDLGHR